MAKPSGDTRGTVSVVLDAATLARLDRIRACKGESRSQVIEEGLKRGLNAVERDNEGMVRRFDALAGRAHMGWQEYASVYAEEFSRHTYPPSVEDLELAETRDGRRLQRRDPVLLARDARRR